MLDMTPMFVHSNGCHRLGMATKQVKFSLAISLPSEYVYSLSEQNWNTMITLPW